MSDEPSAHNSDCESKPNGEPAKEGSDKTKEQGSGSNQNPFFKPSNVAATIGFGLLCFAFMFGWWFQDQLENFFHASPFAVCCIIIILFIFGTVGVAWFCIELWKKPTRIIIAAVVAVLLFIGFVFETERNSPDTNAAETKPYPSFEFFLATSDSQDDALELTNSFLSATGLGRPQLWPIGNVFISKRPEQSDVNLIFWVKNTSKSFSESTEVLVSIDSRLECLPQAGWEREKYGSTLIKTNNLGVLETNRMPQWGYGNFNLLAGDAQNLPFIKLTDVPIKTPFVFCITAKAKDLPVTGITFDLFIMPTNLVRKPFVNAGRFSNGDKISTISPDERRKSLE